MNNDMWGRFDAADSTGRGPRGRRHHDHGYRDGAGPRGPRHGGHGGGPHGGRGGRGGPGGGRGPRAGRGDVRTAVLLLLADAPMHGYQLMKAITDRTEGRWRPSPGAIYPTLAQLEDEGLVTTVAEGGRKLASLTDAGRELLPTLNDPFAELDQRHPGADLRGPARELGAAARQVAMAGTPAQVEAAAKVLAEARRALYRILAEEPDADAASDPTAL